MFLDLKAITTLSETQEKLKVSSSGVKKIKGATITFAPFSYETSPTARGFHV